MYWNSFKKIKTKTSINEHLEREEYFDVELI